MNISDLTLSEFVNMTVVDVNKSYADKDMLIEEFKGRINSESYLPQYFINAILGATL